MIDKLLTIDIANLILDEYNRYHNKFRGINKRAKWHFEQRNWNGILIDKKARLNLYKKAVGDTRNRLVEILSDKLKDHHLWQKVREIYEEFVLNLYYRDIAETFFNSVYRHVHKGLSIDYSIMFVIENPEKLSIASARPLYRIYKSNQTARNLVIQLFQDYKFEAKYEDIERDIDLVTYKIQNELLSKHMPDENTRLEVLRPIFYRNKAAYVVGRAYLGDQIYPFIIPFLNGEKGIYADALLLEYNHIASIFTYYRSYFLVEVDIPYEMIEFLKSILPHKPLSELYTSIGFEKHGKTELFRRFLKHIEENDTEKFEFAEGIKGMVMSVFTLPAFNMVFKVIKDKFAPPKNISEKHVRAKYEFVTEHDRVGRLADTHLFENFKVKKDLFSPALLAELCRDAKSKMTIKEDWVEIKYLYIEKKMTPLNLYLAKANAEETQSILDDYGKALKTLAAANIFPGDLLLKNFGVTRLNRVVFYDYDEIELVTDCTFRQLPTAQSDSDEYHSETWFYVGEKDVFPEEFPPFLFSNIEQKERFLAKHADIFTPQYWNVIKADLQAGKILDVFPYPETQRFGSEGWTD